MGTRVADEILPQVRHNCLVSDAGFWGYYSTCGLLLRLREQFRFEEGILPGEPVDTGTVGPWIEKREAEWQRLEEEPLKDISIGGIFYDPFDAEAINEHLETEGYVYGGGHGIYMKPVFFLAELRRREAIGPYAVLTAGRELVRDLSIHPAMSRSGTIIARSDMVLAMLRDRFEEFRGSRRSGMLARAFEAYGITHDASAGDISSVADSEMESFIRHEYGELFESERLGPDWAGLMEAMGTSRTGLDLRGVKDALADTTDGGMINHIVEEGKSGSLYFYLSSLTGIRYTLASTVRSASMVFMESGDWEVIEKARRESYNTARAVASQCLEAFANSIPEHLEETIKAALLRACPVKQ